MGSLLETMPFGGDVAVPATGYRLYVTGDTLVHDALHEVPRRYPDIDCALVHLGGTRLLGVPLSMDAAQGTDLLRIVRPRHAIGIHADDYRIQRSPLSDFTAAVSRAEDVRTTVHVLRRGTAEPLPK